MQPTDSKFVRRPCTQTFTKDKTWGSRNELTSRSIHGRTDGQTDRQTTIKMDCLEWKIKNNFEQHGKK